MEITISKNDFESALPVGMSAHDEVYESIEPEINKQLVSMGEQLLGEDGEKVIEGYGEKSQVLLLYKQVVCLKAFIGILRQLDLVLTPTGFGIVSNDKVSPASKQRVDALDGQLRTYYYKVLGSCINRLRSKEWGMSEQARFWIPYLYDINYFFNIANTDKTYQDWGNMSQVLIDTDEFLRSMISDAQMDDILECWRCKDGGRFMKYQNAIHSIRGFVETYAAKGEEAKHLPVYRRLMSIIDSDEDAETFALYRASKEYKKNHITPFRNEKESPAFVFGG